MKTIIEAGHYYQVNGPSALSIKGWEIGKELVASQVNSDLVLFVDDYHQEQTFLEQGDAFFSSDEATQVARIICAEATHVFSESILAADAPKKISELLDDGLVKLKKGVVSAAGIRLGCLR